MSMKLAGMILLAAVLVLPGIGFAETAKEAIVNKERAVKAAYIYNFLKFSDWPEESFETPESPVMVCFFGDDPIEAQMRESVMGKMVRERMVMTRRIKRSAGASMNADSGCHALYISGMDANEAAKIANGIPKNSSILTIGDMDGFAKKGGSINFVPRGTNLKIQINTDTIEGQGIHVSSRLLSIAELVNE
ncbi:MAG: YfiR family protein [Deltaproteobacteria bacterium]|nr:YfiR family protein [Deltaproteobacteria bacterium]